MPMIQDPRWTAINLDGTPCAGAELTVYTADTDIKAEAVKHEVINFRGRDGEGESIPSGRTAE